jgi:hypothetical protein
LTLSGNNSYGSGTILSGGTLNINSDSALGSGSITFTGNSTLQLAATIVSSSKNIAINPGITGTIDTNGFNLNSSGSLSGSGTLEKAGIGTYTHSANSIGFTGTLQVDGGTFAMSSSGAIPSGNVSLTSSTSIFNVSGVVAVTTIQDLSGNNTTSSVVLGAKGLTLGSSNSTTYAGTISGVGGSLTKQGSGHLSLYGACSPLYWTKNDLMKTTR